MIFRLYFFLLSLPLLSYANSNSTTLEHPYFIKITPPYLNENFMALETGFITQKSLKAYAYDYNAFVSAFLAREVYKANQNLKTAELGFKGGLLLPLHELFPVLIMLNGGYAKTSFQEDPIWGKTKQSLSQKDMFFYEVGILGHYEKYIVTALYQKNNLKTVEQNYFISFGITFH